MCVPHTPYTPVLKFVPLAGRVSGAATHAVGIDAGYGLLYRFVICIDYRLIQTLRACVPHTSYTLVLKFVPLQVGCVA